jgi:hypothetical protein
MLDDRAEALFRTKFTVGLMDECWPWRGPKNPDGYGKFKIQRDKHATTYGAHRLAYQLLRGPVPVGLVIDHLCRVRHCVNPWHMEPVTNRENLRRGSVSRGRRNILGSACRNGHPYVEGSFVVRCRPMQGVLRTWRECLICARARTRPVQGSNL